jgi:hypothetical protein
MSTIPILPFEQKIIKIVAFFSIHITELILNESAVFRVSLYDENESCINNCFVSIDGEDYKKWSNDDSYIVKFVSAKLGFTLA